MDKEGVIWKQGTSQLFKTGGVLLYFDYTADWSLIDESSNQHKMDDNGFHNDLPIIKTISRRVALVL